MDDHRVGDQLRELREHAGLSQPAVANELGISRQAVTQWEKGRTRPDVHRLRRLDELYAAGGKVLELFNLSADDYSDQLEAMRATLAEQNRRIAELERRLSGGETS